MTCGHGLLPRSTEAGIRSGCALRESAGERLGRRCSLSPAEWQVRARTTGKGAAATESAGSGRGRWGRSSFGARPTIVRVCTALGAGRTMAQADRAKTLRFSMRVARIRARPSNRLRLTGLFTYEFCGH
jgi:hypothetical protein